MLTSDPKMINIIYKILTANDAEQHKDDNNDNNGNAIKYLESNKDNILDLVEKHYENLVEALTKNVITAPLLLLSSLLIFDLPAANSANIPAKSRTLW